MKHYIAGAFKRFEQFQADRAVSINSSDTRRTSGGQLVTDGGSSPRAALDQHQHDESARRLATAAATGSTSDLEPTDVYRGLALAGGDLCVEIAHKSGTEWIWLDDEWSGLESLWSATDRSITRGPISLDLDDVANRIRRSKPIALRWMGDVDAVAAVAGAQDSDARNSVGRGDESPADRSDSGSGVA